jgi:hypothetical protein
VVFTNRLNPPGDVGAEDVAARPAQPVHAGVQRSTRQSFPIGSIDGDGVHFDEDLVIGGDGFGDVGEAEDVGQAVFGVDECFQETGLAERS